MCREGRRTRGWERTRTISPQELAVDFHAKISSEHLKLSDESNTPLPVDKLRSLAAGGPEGLGELRSSFRGVHPSPREDEQDGKS